VDTINTVRSTLTVHPILHIMLLLLRIPRIFSAVVAGAAARTAAVAETSSTITDGTCTTTSTTTAAQNLPALLASTSTTGTTTISTPAASNNNNEKSLLNDECVVWRDFNTSETTNTIASLLQDDTVIRTETCVACRVLHDPEQKYYEFGTLDLSGLQEASEEEGDDAPSSLCACVLHRDPRLRYREFQIAVKNETRCDHFWAPLAFDVDPLGPNIVRMPDVRAPELDSSPDGVAICRVTTKQGDEVMGRLMLQGRLFGHCGYLSKDNTSGGGGEMEETYVGGNFHVLSAIPRGAVVVQENAGSNHGGDFDGHGHQWNSLVTAIQERVTRYLSVEDKHLIASISGHSVEELLNDLNNTDIVSYDVLSHVLTTDRFIPHDVLNKKGLSLLRAVLAERMTLARRRNLGLDKHPDTVVWERDGVLLKDFDHYTNEQNKQEFDELLQMVAASKSVSSTEFKWVERNVTSMPNDPQREPHIDTFHSVVKMWVYERGVVTLESGPLHFMRGSHRNTPGKLRWMYNASLPPATEAIKEPSLRFHGDVLDSSSETCMSDILRPVLPLDCYNRTLVIADTSGIHHRGNAIPGTVRKTIRVSSGHDGGLKRQNPYQLWGEEC